EVWRSEFFDQSNEIFCQRHGMERLLFVNHPPYPPAGAVAARMREGHFVVAYDPIVEVGDVERAVRTDCRIDGTEPGIVRAHEVGHRAGDASGAFLGKAPLASPARCPTS